MPQAASRPCTHPGCGALVSDGSGRCARHRRPAWSKPAGATKRVTGRKLQRKRSELFARSPLCSMCSERGRVTLATVRDHKTPLAEGGADDDSNVQGLCDACHEEKTLAEALRGRARQSGWGGIESLSPPNGKPAA